MDHVDIVPRDNSQKDLFEIKKLHSGECSSAGKKMGLSSSS